MGRRKLGIQISVLVCCNREVERAREEGEGRRGEREGERERAHSRTKN